MLDETLNLLINMKIHHLFLILLYYISSGFKSYSDPSFTFFQPS